MFRPDTSSITLRSENGPKIMITVEMAAIAAVVPTRKRGNLGANRKPCLPPFTRLAGAADLAANERVATGLMALPSTTARLSGDVEG